MRRATAQLELNNFESAINDLRAGLQLEPTNNTIKSDLDSAIEKFNEAKAKAQAEERQKTSAMQAKLGSGRVSDSKTKEKDDDLLDLPEPVISNNTTRTVVAEPSKPQASASPVKPPSVIEKPQIEIILPTVAPKSFYVFEQTFSSLSGRLDLTANYFKVRR